MLSYGLILKPIHAHSSFFIAFDNTLERKWISTVKPVLCNHSKLDKTKVFKTNVSLMKVEGMAECSLRAFCNTFDLH